jgi:hypothetical protein
MSIVLQGSTSGSVTLQEPAVAGTTVLDLPATSGTLDRTNRAGNVLQVVHGQLLSDRITVSSSSFVTVGNGVTITPSSTSSKILVKAQIGVNIKQELSIGRGGNTNITGVSHGLVTETDDNWTTQSLFYFDSPNSTSAQTYYVTARGYNGSTSTVYISDFSTGGPFAYMILMEIAA